MTAATPGQAAYEALHESITRRQPAHMWVTWDVMSEINDGIPGEPLREDLEASAQAAIDHYRDNRAVEQEQAAPVGEQPEPELERLRRMLAKVTKERDLLFGSMPLGEAKAVLSGRELRDVVLDEPQPAPEAAGDGQALFTRCWQGVHASTAGARPAQLWRAMDDHHRSLWAHAATVIGLGAATAERDRYRELLDEIGVMAANAPEDGDSFGLLEEIAMRIAGAGAEPQAAAPRVYMTVMRGTVALRDAEIKRSHGEARGYRDALAQVARMAEARGAARSVSNIAEVARRALEGR